MNDLKSYASRYLNGLRLERAFSTAVDLGTAARAGFGNDVLFEKSDQRARSVLIEEDLQGRTAAG